MNNLKIAFLLILLSITGFCASAQHVTKADTIVSFPEKKAHSPRKATIYSAILPGLGQIYNRKYWKVPIVYGGFITFGYIIDWNNDHYVLYKQGYSDIIDDDPNTNSFKNLDLDGRYNFDNPSQLKQFGDKLKLAKDAARRNRDYAIIWTAAFYALNIIDASVDANFFDFDISDDLSFKWIPGPVYCANHTMMGVHCRIRF